MFTLFFGVYSVAHAALLSWGVRLWRRDNAPGAPIICMIAAGLIYDNLMIAIGATLGAGPLLMTLSWPRFALHAICTPFTMIAVWQFANAANFSWARDRRAWAAVWIFVIAMVILGMNTGLIGLEIHPACFQDVLRYSSAVSEAQLCFPEQMTVAGHGPPIPSISTAVVALGVGIALWRGRNWPWLLGGALAMMVAASVPTSQYGLTASNGGEVILLTSYAATAARFSRGRATV
ncbi:MAG: hypothetical protein OER85_18745 [Gammaproteobacteria bacterium]|nr:hypothetical protein [Gammaproteobacteria bacterium]